VSAETTVPDRFPRPKHVAEKVEGLVRKITTSVPILAIDEFRLLRIENQLAGRKAILQRTPQRPRLFGALAVTDAVVRVSLERDVRIDSRHPHVERVVQEQIRQDGADYALNAKGNFQFERAIRDWRGCFVVDLRHKR